MSTHISYRNVSLAWEFHLLLLCWCNVLLFSLQILRCHPHMLHFFLPSFPFCSSSSSLSPPQQMHLHLRKENLSAHGHHTFARADTQTHTGLNQPSAAIMLITSHSNMTNDFLRQISVDREERYHRSSLQYPAPKPDERSMIYRRAVGPGAHSRTQSTRPREGKSTSERGVMVQRASNHTRAASAEHMLQLPCYRLCSGKRHLHNGCMWGPRGHAGWPESCAPMVLWLFVAVKANPISSY